MALSLRSQSFHDTRKELEDKLESGDISTADEVDAIIRDRGEDVDEFNSTYEEYNTALDSGETDFRGAEGDGGFGMADRLAGRAVGDLGRAALNLGDAILPEAVSDAVESAADAVGEYIPDTFKEEFDQIFDPYHGEVDSIEQGAGELMSYLIPIGSGIKIANGVMRGAQYISPMMRNFVAKSGWKTKAAGWGAAAGIGEGLIEKGASTTSDPTLGDYAGGLPMDVAWGIPIGLGAGAAGVVAKKVFKKGPKKYKKKSKVADLLTRNFSSRRGTDDEVLQAVIQRDNAADKALSISQGLNNDLQKALKVSGVKLTPDFLDNVVNSALNGEPQAIRALRDQAPDAARIVNKMRKSIDKLSKFTSKKIARGELKATIDSNMGLYLNRSFEAFDNPTFRNNLKKRIKNKAGSDQVMTNARTWARRELTGSKGVPTDEQVDRFLMDLVEEKGIDSGGAFEALSSKLGGSSNVLKKKQKNMPKELREFYGEVKNPYSNYSKTFEKLSKVKAEYDFLADMKDHLLSTGALKRAADRGVDDDNFRPAAEAMNDRLGAIFGKGNMDKGNVRNPLDGLYVDKSYGKFMRDGLDGVFDSPKGTKNVGALAVLGRTWLRAKSLSQSMKTVYNPATHVANTLGQSAILLANGMVPLGKGAGKALSVTMHKLAGKTDEDMGKYLGRASELGITDSGVTVSMIKKNMEQGGGDPLKFMEKSIMGRAIDASVKKPNAKVMGIYQAEDDVFKLIHWEKTKDYLKKAYPKKPMKEIEEMAAQRTRDMMPNYPMAGRLVQGARALPVGDFISFPAEMIRTTGKMLSYTASDAASGIPTLQKAAAKRLAGMTAVGTIPAMAHNYSRNSHDITPEEEEALNQTLPPYQAYGNRIYTSGINKDGNGHMGVDMITLNSLDPYDYLKTMSKELHQAALGDTPPDVERATNALISNQIETFTGPSMLTKAMGKLIEGESLADAVGTEDTIGAALKLIVDPFKPGFVNWFDRRKEREKSMAKFGGDEGYRSKSLATITEDMTGARALFGVGNKRHDITAGFNYNMAPHLSKAMNAGKDFTQKLKDPNLSLEDNDLKRRFFRAQEDKMSAQQNIHVLMNAYRELGMDDVELNSALTINKGMDVSGNKMNLLYSSENDVFSPFYLGDEDIEYMKRFSGNVVDVDELYSISKELDGSTVMPPTDEED